MTQDQFRSRPTARIWPAARRPLAPALLLALALLALPGASRAQSIDAGAAVVTEPLANEGHPLPNVTTGGAPPDAAGFVALAATGHRIFVDLRPETEAGAAAAEGYATAAGMEYVRIAVSGEGDLDLPSARALDRVLDAATGAPVVVACASGNRAGALLAVEAFWLDGVPAAEALEIGRRGGLTRLEPVVRTLLGLAAAPPAPHPVASPPAPR
jgi:protein tyrosine phosphatase (PTP) superfamily phosphohydrolase (DUF442 family)